MQTAFIVDDDADTAEMLRITLETEGFKAAHYLDFAHALAEVHRGPCIALIDYHVRKSSLTFEQFVSELRKHVPNIEIVALTGDARTKAQCTNLQVDDFLLKPFDTNAIIDIVGQHCPRTA
jgi:DNA-binding response OmpR family regulator